jgi:hypothetical protein
MSGKLCAQQPRRPISPPVRASAGPLSGSVTDIFHSVRYRLYDGDKPLSRTQLIDYAVWSTVAIPEEKQDRLAS